MAKKSDGSFSVKTVDLILTRDERKCVRCGQSIWGERGLDWSIHHRKPRGSGGTSDPLIGAAANGVVLCGSGTTGCHGAVESNRKKSLEWGYLISRNGVRNPAEVPIFHALRGWVNLDDEGGMT